MVSANIMIPSTETVRDILDGSVMYEIPEFQRDYSWKKIQHIDFLKDLLSNLGRKYFFGTIIIVNKDTDKSGNKVYSLIDGQQRLTTFVILLQAIRDLIIQHRDIPNNKTSYDSLLFKTISNNLTGDEIIKSVLVNAKFEPILPLKILKIGNVGSEIEPSSLEQKSILSVYEMFMNGLSYENIIKTINTLSLRPNNDIQKYLFLDDPKNNDYIKFLIKIADQLVNFSSMVVIKSDSQKFAQTIFKNLNSRGIPLNSIDLIKNDLFDVLNYQEDSPAVEDTWSNILQLTTLGKTAQHDPILPEEFFSRYWNLTHKMSAKAAYNRKMYEYFEKNIKPAKDSYLDLLKSFQYSAQLFNSFFTVGKEDPFMGVSGYFKINGHFEILSYIWFLRGYSQERTLVLAMFIAREKEFLANKQFKKMLKAITYFRIIWQISGGRPNRLAFFDRTAKELYSATIKDSKDGLKEAIEHLKYELRSHITSDDGNAKDISFDDLFKRIGTIKYTHEKKDTNQLVKLVLTMFEISKRRDDPMNNEFENIYSAQIEHIIPLSQGNDSLSQGNDSLPNLALISEQEEKEIAKKNSKDKFGNDIAANFLEKRDVYRNSNWSLLKEVADQKKFLSDELELRRKDMATSIFDCTLKTIDSL